MNSLFNLCTMTPRGCLLVLCALISGCGNDPLEIRVLEHLPRPAVGEAPADGSSAEKTAAWLWETPENWVVAEPGAMQFARFTLSSDHGEGEASLTALAGDAGGTYANVNRWRGQIGLPQLEPSDIDPLLHEENSPAGAFLWTLLEGPNKSILATIVSLKDQTLFVKLMGPGPLLEKEKPAVLQLTRSLRPR